jgi:hypothetical protein
VPFQTTRDRFGRGKDVDDHAYAISSPEPVQRGYLRAKIVDIEGLGIRFSHSRVAMCAAI